jgi:hypothetical protein
MMMMMMMTTTTTTTAAHANEAHDVRAPQEEPVLPRVPFAACVERWAGTEEMGEYFSAALGRRTTGLRRSRIASFPPFLMVQLKRCAAAFCIYHMLLLQRGQPDRCYPM